MRGYFIDLEGSDGSGKSTVVAGLRQRVEAAGIRMNFTREPGGTPISEKIRSLLLDRENAEMGARCEALLYAAARAQHTDRHIVPLLQAGTHVFTERYILSSLAYQGYGRGLGMEAVYAVNRFATGGLEPDLVLYLDADPLLLLRRKEAQKQADRLEAAGDVFFQRVQEGYRQALSWSPHVLRIDATQEADQVIEACWQAIITGLKEKV